MFPGKGPGPRLVPPWVLAVTLPLAIGVIGLIVLERLDLMVWVAEVNTWLADKVIHRLGYLGVFLLMMIESSLIPFPSEIIIPPAADLARRLPDWSLMMVIVLGTAGSLAGAVFNYTLARLLGRPLLLRFIARYGPYLRLSQPGYERAEAFFARHGAISTLAGRMIPGIRQIISLPAGLARMPLFGFCLLTSLGAGAWVTVLALAGYWFGANAELLAETIRDYTLWLAVGMIALIGGYAVWYRLRTARGPSPSHPDPPEGP